MALGNSSRQRAIKRIDIRSLALIAGLFGFIGGLVTLALISAMISGTAQDPDWVELSTGFLSIKRSYPIAPWLFYSWPLLAAAGNAIGAVIVGLLYNIFARFIVPLRVQLSD